MSGRPSCITFKCEKHVITVLRYKFGSVYISNIGGVPGEIWIVINDKVFSINTEFSIGKIFPQCICIEKP